MEDFNKQKDERKRRKRGIGDARYSLPFPIKNLRQSHISMLEGQCKVDPVENKAPVPEKLKTALIAFFKDDEFWCTHQEHDLNLSAAEWMKLTSAVFTARSLCRSSNIPVIPLGDTPFPYKPTDTISGLMRNIVDGRGWPYVVSKARKAKAASEINILNPQKDIPPALALLYSSVKCHQTGNYQSILFNLSVTAFCLAARDIGILQFPKQKKKKQTSTDTPTPTPTAWELLLEEIASKCADPGCKDSDAFKSLLANDRYNNPHFEPLFWQLPYHIAESGTYVVLLQTRRMFNRSVNRFHLAEMAQALDALQKPKLLVDTEDIIAEHTAKLSRCEIDLDTAAQTIIDRCGSLLDGISVPESVSKFFFPCNVGVNSGTGNCPAVPNRPLAPEVSPSLTSDAPGSGLAFFPPLTSEGPAPLPPAPLMLSPATSGGAGVFSNSTEPSAGPHPPPEEDPQLSAMGEAQVLAAIVQEWRRFCVQLDQDPGFARESLLTVVKAIENQPSVIKPLCSASVQVTPHSFGRLGPEGLLNDQLIAHFLYKWAVESPKRNTLCLEPYFARFLFSDDAHLEHKQVLNETEKLMSNLPTVLKKQGIKSLDHCFLVINEDNRHWYSAIIDFTQHKIAVNDSLPSWKRRQIIPGLIWLTTALAAFRGEKEEQILSGWNIIPQAKVPRQSDNTSCGLHVLLHLKHLLKFSEIRGEEVIMDPMLSFTPNMTGKRFQLVDELLQECGYSSVEFL